MTSKIRVLIVENSPAVRGLLGRVIGADPRFEVVGAVESGERALGVLARPRPHVISMDVSLPGVDGLESTKRIMHERPTPIVIVSGLVDSKDVDVTMNALRSGALSVVEKPVSSDDPEFETCAQRLCNQLAIMSDVKVISQRDRPLRGPARKSPPRHPPTRRATGYDMLGVVASTGGPRALQRVLGSLPAELPMPVVVVQHLNERFVEGFAAWLDGTTPLRVELARDGERPVPGRVYVAPGERHLKVEYGRLRTVAASPVNGQLPSGTLLLASMADDLGERALGVVLTGMGDDGARGLLDVRNAGGYTIAEAASTAIVYGMPAAAAELGGVDELLPLPDIAPRIQELVSQKEQVHR